MKGIILFDNLNDLAFIDADEELILHIQHLAFKDGLLQDLSFQDEDGEVNKDIVMQLFSPIIASYKVMHVQFGNKCKYIESEDGVLLFFSEILNYIAILICNAEDDLQDMQKELSLFQICVESLYGPALHMIKENIPTCCDTVSRSKFLTFIFKKWRLLKMEQQMFLVEAIERLIINQEITALCINLLQEILEKIRSAHKEATYSHAFLIVDTKLLALYSSRNSGQLPKETLLFLILLAQTLKFASKKSQENEKDNYVDDEFFIPITSDPSNALNGKDFRNMQQNQENNNNSLILKAGALSLLIYLKSRSGLLVPHILYVIEVAPSIDLVIISELTQYGVISSCLSSLCTSLHSFLSYPSQHHLKYSFETLETDFRSLIDSLWKMKLVSNVDNIIRRLVSKWEQLKQCDKEVQKSQIINPRLESVISSLCDVLKSTFEEVVAIQCLQYEEDTMRIKHQESFITVQKIGCRRLLDVGDFLEVKAMQNVAMSSYASEYPGLIHFIYIDRNCDCLIAPTVILRKSLSNEISTLKEKDGLLKYQHPFIKDGNDLKIYQVLLFTRVIVNLCFRMVWKMVSVGRRHLDGVNKFCCLWKEGDLYFFYTIWFEDDLGKVIKPIAYPSLKNFPEKGIICGNFFKKLVQECFPGASYDHIFCYEIFCIHLDSTPVDTIVDHSRKLCGQLWDFTGAYRTSLDLL